MTKEQAALFHVELWNDIAENGYWNKLDSIILKRSKKRYLNNCSLCEYGKYRFKKSSNRTRRADWCDYCPLEHCNKSFSLFNRWRYTNSRIKLKNFAIAIADAIYENNWIKI